jgi:hypothetical protein
MTLFVALLCAMLLGALPARAETDRRPLTPQAHRFKVAGIVLLSISSSAALTGIGFSASSVYYNVHWKGHEDAGPAYGFAGGVTFAAAGIVAAIGMPLAFANERETVTVRVSPVGVTGTF